MNSAAGSERRVRTIVLEVWKSRFDAYVKVLQKSSESLKVAGIPSRTSV